MTHQTKHHETDPSQAPRQPTTVLTPAAIDRLIDEHFPAIHFGARTLFIDALTDDGALIRLRDHEKNIRPGGTVSGPALFTLADYGAYVAILARFGASALQAVTTSTNLTFLRRPTPGDVVGRVRLVKTGRRLQIVEVEMVSGPADDVVAHAMLTYMMPGT